VIGVVKDYHHLSLREEIKPMIYLGSVSFSYYTVQLDATNLSGKIATLKSLYAKSFPGNPFEYFFADEKVQPAISIRSKTGEPVCSRGYHCHLYCLSWTVWACRFFGKATGERDRYTKSAGCHVADITSLLSVDFIRPVLVAITIASPLSWWMAQLWLQDFAYRTNVSWWIFFAAGVTVILIVLATVSLLAVRAARANPVNSLRTE
jgi:putative ABC transport system permease protein